MKKIFTLIIILLSFSIMACCAEVSPDKEILMRTPTIDGKIIPGEWDIFYSIPEENNSIVTYANWDSKNLYLAAECNAIDNFAIMVDLNADGWTVGEDNYLIKTNENGEIDILKVVKTGDNGVTLVSVVVSQENQIHAEKSLVNGKTNIEISIPATMFDLGKFSMGNLNFNLSIEAPVTGWSSFNPNDITDNTFGCKLVNYKSSSLEPFSIEFFLTKQYVVAGDTLDGKVKIKNNSKEAVVVKELIMAGEGLCEDLVSSSKIIVGEIKPGKTFEREYHTRVLADTDLGCKVLGCEIYTKDMKVGGALRSFQVINQAVFSPYVPKPVCYTSDKVIRLGVRVISYSDKKYSTGFASVVVPEGWEIEGNNHNKFSIKGYNKYVDLIFRLTPPLGAVGHYKIPVVVNMGDTQETVICDFDIVQSK